MGKQAFSRIYIIVILVIFVIGGIFLWQYKQPKEEKPRIPKAEISKIEISEENVTKALSICEKIKDSERRNICAGIVNGDLEACEILPEWKKVDCYISLGFRTGNASLCERLKDEELQYECLARLTKDYEKCKKGVTVSGDNCYYDVAILKGDSLGCKNITDELLRNKCSAYLERNSDDCQKLSETIFRNDCYTIVAIITNNPSICYKMEGGKRDVCIALVEKNLEKLDLICVTAGGYCEFLAPFTKNASICEKMGDGDYCYFGVAIGLLGIYPPEGPLVW